MVLCEMASLLHFKNPGDIFSGRVSSFKSLRIGLEAYKRYLEYRLEETLSIVNKLYDTVSDGDSAYTVPVSWNIPYDDRVMTFIGSANLRELKKVVSGQATGCVIGALGNTGSESGSYGITIDDIADHFANKISGLQGQIAIYGAALKSDLNSKVDMSLVSSELSIRGYLANQYVAGISDAIDGGMTWLDAIMAISNTSKVEVAPDGYTYNFSADAFSNTNAFLLAFNTIVDTVSGFFEDINFQLSKIGEFFKALWNGFVDLAVWVLSMIAGDVFCDYVVNNDFNMECLDIPIASVQISRNDLISQAATITSSTNIPFTPVFQGTLSSGNNAYNSKSYKVYYNPDLAGLCRKIDSYLRNDDLVVVPWARGHVLVSRSSDVITAYYFLGDFTLVSGFMNFNASSTGEVSLLNVNPSYTHSKASSRKFNDNNSFCTWFKSLFDAPIGSDGLYGLANNADFLGNGETLVDTAMVFPCKYNLSSIDGPKTIVDACSSHYYDGVDNSVSARLLVNALMLTNISKADKVLGNIGYYDGDEVLTSNTLFENGMFMPYMNKVCPQFKYHAQTDSERTNEVLDTVKKVAIAAVVTGVAVGIHKSKVNLKKKAMQQKALADRLWMEAVAETPQDMPAVVDAAYKASKRATRLSKLAGLVGGATAEAGIVSSIVELSRASNPDGIEMIRGLITN